MTTNDFGFDDIGSLDATEWEAVVYDLDGTLVRLVVDWDAAAAEVEDVLRTQNTNPPTSLWGMLAFAEREGHRERVEEVLRRHECEGARQSRRLALADVLAGMGNGENGAPPVGICSLNSEAACRLALRLHRLTDRVECVVGRDTCSAYKPDPEPLLTVVSALDATPARTLFVGDSERDAETAARAGTRFVYVSALDSEDTDTDAAD